MNKTAIKNFAIWARKKLISDITYKAGLIGINEKGISTPLEMSTNDVQFFDVGTGIPTKISGNEIKQRDSLIKYIREKESTTDYKAAFHLVIEEVAYTWFNRLIAIRFMEVNDYLPSNIRVISSEIKGKIEPDIVTRPFETDLEFNSYEVDRIIQLKDENKLDELFRMLFTKQCNKLNEVLPELFETTNDYTEFLLNISFTDSDGIISHLINDIEEEEFIEAVEIIGWMYQYYNTEPKDELINARSKYKKDDIPYVTQLFTSDWIVRFIVDNSLGKHWIERNQNSKLQDKLEYFVKPKIDHMYYLNDRISPEELTFFDPCMGSGHILVYAFDVLMEIYRENGYSDREAAQAIIKNNLFGLDIDTRAYQLAYFAVMMKARSYDRRFLTRGIEPNVFVIKEVNPNTNFICDGVTNDKEQNEIGEYLINIFKNAQEIGSLLSVENYDYQLFIDYLDKLKLLGQLTLESEYWYREIIPIMKKLAKQAIIMSQKYTIVCTNPPYMNNTYMTPVLKKYIEDNFMDYKVDIFSAFMVKCLDYCKEAGKIGLLTPYVWMFISSYEKLRKKILENTTITTLVQLEYNAFEAACVPVCAFTLENGKSNHNGDYIKLSDFKGIEVQAPKTLEAIHNASCDYRYSKSQKKFSEIPSSPIAYWASDTAISAFNNKNIGMLGQPRVGLQTGENDRFTRQWFEVDLENLKLDATTRLDALESQKKWFPYNKGGEFRKWYGNNNYVVNWKNDGEEIRAFRDKNGKLRSRPQNMDFYFKKSITWSKISSGSIAFRYKPNGHIFDVAGTSLFLDEKIMNYICGFCNSKVALQFAKILSPTLNYEVGHISNFPVIEDEKHKLAISSLVSDCIEVSKEDWDSYETSWDFITHPLVTFRYKSEADNNSNEFQYRIEEAFNQWKLKTEINFKQLKANEEEINRIFIDIYGLHNELTPDVEDKDVTIRKADLKRDIKSFISYAVGCMFGRYSLDCDGLGYAGGEWNDNKYRSFIPNKDNCILITDEEYFEDDIVNLFVKFVQNVYGAKNLEDNLDFIAKALGNKGNTSREVIRNYFIKDFYKDHVKTYQKRPIYWLYDSGKQNSFKVLVYMHRYNADTTGLVRVDYLHKIQKIYTSEIERMQDMIENGENSSEISQAEKRKEKLVKQLKETKEYDEKIAHLALSRIEIDLDDGVKVNYDKVQTTQDGKKLSILAKI